MKLKFFAKELKHSFVRIHEIVLGLCFTFFLVLLGSATVFSQTTALSFNQLSYDDLDYVAPGRGAEQWHNASQAIGYPSRDQSHPSMDVYYRFTWNRLEGPGQGSYTWDFFDGIIRDAINKGQKLSFGIMSCYPDGSGQPGVVEYDNGNSAYPEYLHWMMQAESETDWKSTGYGLTTGYGTWVPNWNSPQYLARLRALHEAVNQHILTSTYQATGGPHAGRIIAFKDVINSIDIRGYGSWGEWHSHSIVDVMTSYPGGRRPTAASLKTIIDHHVNVFQDFPLSMMISSFDAEMLPNTKTPKEVTDYILSRSNRWGKLGWRRDNWGDVGVYLDRYLRDNFESFGGSGPFNAIILDRWKYAPVTGEAPGWLPTLDGGCAYDDLLRQVREYHTASIGNGNFGTSNPSECVQNNLRSAFKATGYRIVVEGGNISSSISAGQSFSIELNWKNIGVAPTYENWDVVFQLKNAGNEIVWSGTSQFKPRLFLPQPGATVIKDNFTLPSNIAVGDYVLSMIVRDPSGYRQPLPLAIEGRGNDGGYQLKNVFVDATASQPGEPACLLTQAAISATESCKDQTFYVVLSSADGAAPYNVVVNGVNYRNVQVGDTLFSVTDSVKTGGPVSSARESIWNEKPAANNYEDQSVELGVRFQAAVSGTAAGVRFFSPSNADGEYVGHLWSPDGSLLATARFSQVTGGEWQEALFETPVTLSAGQVYTVSYFTSSGRYAATPRGLENTVSNGNSLTALATASTGGVYRYGAPGLPVASYNATNYWADVIFTPLAPSAANLVSGESRYDFSLQSITDSAGCTVSSGLQPLTVTPKECLQSRPADANQTLASAQSVTMTAEEVPSREKRVANSLDQNYPNPFRNQTMISYFLAEPAQINLSLFDINGRLVRVLATGYKDAGKHNLRFNAASLRPGLYFYRLTSGRFDEVKKMLVQ